MRARHLFTFPLSLAVAAPLLAQDGAVSLRTSAPPQSAEVTEDLGEISPPGEAPPRVQFRANANMRGNYTTNAGLTGNHGAGDFLWMPTVEAGFSAQLGRGFSFDFAAKVESVFYSRFDERAFAGYSANATLDWRMKPNLPRIYVGAEPYRYDSYDTGDLITQAVGLHAGTDYGIGFNGGNSLAFAGYQFTHYFADPDIDDRSSQRAVIGLTHQIRPQLYGQLFYAYQYTDFTSFDRTDHRHILSLSLAWQLNRRLFTTLAGSLVDNDSTQARGSYQGANASLGLTWQF